MTNSIDLERRCYEKARVICSPNPSEISVDIEPERDYKFSFLRKISSPLSAKESELEQLLQKEYDTLTVSWNTIQKVIEYVRETPNVEGKDVIFLKKLTKVTSNISSRNSSFLEPYFERIFQYHLETISNIEKIEVEHNEYLSATEKVNLKKMKSHLYNHNADFALKIGKRLQISQRKIKIQWYKIALEMFDRCENLCVDQGDYLISIAKQKQFTYSLLEGLTGSKKFKKLAKKSAKFYEKYN